MNEGVPQDFLDKWNACKHDFVTSIVGMTAGIYTLECCKCGYRMRTEPAVWTLLKKCERV
jgi:Zn ribbon nucleic-acid-binding protein